MKKNNTDASFKGLAEVYQMVLDSLRFFGRIFNLNMRQIDVILTLGIYPELTLKELCEETGIPKSSASQVVDSLVERELVSRTVPPENRRSVKIALSEKFRKELRKMDDGKELQKILTKHLTKEQGFMAIEKLMELQAILNRSSDK